jgi:hypothetical protein
VELAVTLPITANLFRRYDAQALTGLADGDPVTTWPDTSGNGGHATGAGPVYKTGVLHGRPSVRFDGVDDILLNVFGTTITGARTTYAVVRNPTNDNAVRVFVGAGYNTSANRGIKLSKWSNANRWIAGRSSSGGEFIEFYEAGLLGQDCVWSMVQPASGATVVRAQKSQRASGSIGLGEVRNIGLGGLPNFSGTAGTAARWFSGDIFEVLLYDVAHTASEVEQIENWLHDRWLVAGGGEDHSGGSTTTVNVATVGAGTKPSAPTNLQVAPNGAGLLATWSSSASEHIVERERWVGIGEPT